MANFLLKSIPPQAVKIYTLLLKGKPMTAKDIGRRLSIFPNTVYRAIKNLLELGMVDETTHYPKQYQAKKMNESAAILQSIINQNFHEAFGQNDKFNAGRDLLQLKFIRTRKELLDSATQDMRKAQIKANLIVSGHEIPAEVVLAHKKAAEQGVKIRILVQCLNEKNRQMLKYWQKMGMEIRYYPNMEARIFIFDELTVYFTSYNPRQNKEAIGVRFAYAPYARLMDELFEQRWGIAREIKK